MIESLEIRKDISTLDESLSPVLSGLSFYGEYLGVPIYSNKKIETAVLLAVLKERKELYPIISNGINTKHIVVGYTSSSRLKFFVNRLKKLTGRISKTDLGWFDNNTETIGVILDFNVNVFGKTIFDIPNTLLHELVHLAFYQNRITKISENTMGIFLIPYFKILIKEMYQIILGRELKDVLDETELEYTIKELIGGNERQNTSETNLVWVAVNTWDKFFRNNLNLTDNELLLMTQGMVTPYKKEFTKFNTLSFDENTMTKILLAFRKPYKYFQMTEQNIIPGQETIYPSEIVSECSSNRPLNYTILKSINKIKMR